MVALQVGGAGGGGNSVRVIVPDRVPVGIQPVAGRLNFFLVKGVQALLHQIVLLGLAALDAVLQSVRYLGQVLAGLTVIALVAVHFGPVGLDGFLKVLRLLRVGFAGGLELIHLPLQAVQRGAQLGGGLLIGLSGVLFLPGQPVPGGVPLGRGLLVLGTGSSQMPGERIHAVLPAGKAAVISPDRILGLLGGSLKVLHGDEAVGLGADSLTAGGDIFQHRQHPAGLLQLGDQVADGKRVHDHGGGHHQTAVLQHLTAQHRRLRQRVHPPGGDRGQGNRVQISELNAVQIGGGSGIQVVILGDGQEAKPVLHKAVIAGQNGVGAGAERRIQGPKGALVPPGLHQNGGQGVKGEEQERQEQGNGAPGALSPDLTPLSHALSPLLSRRSIP